MSEQVVDELVESAVEPAVESEVTTVEGFEALDINFDMTMPKSARRGGGGGAGRPAKPWEKLLNPARLNPGKAGFLGSFSSKEKEIDGKRVVVSGQSRATARATVIGNRLREMVPLEQWRFNTRKMGEGEVGLWVTYVKTFSPEEYAEFDLKRKERASKIKAGRVKKAAQRSETPSEQTAADKVRAARAVRSA